jgi:hypothetical protein
MGGGQIDFDMRARLRGFTSPAVEMGGGKRDFDMKTLLRPRLEHSIAALGLGFLLTEVSGGGTRQALQHGLARWGRGFHPQQKKMSKKGNWT